MRTLVLPRHAKSSWKDESLADIDRPLNKRGRKAAPEMAAHLAGRGLVPDLVLCSPARRTRETLELLVGSYGRPLETRIEVDLYMAGEARILDWIRAVDAKVETLFVIGHNPGLQDVAQLLLRDADGEGARRMRSKFPTAAAAIIDFDTDDWHGVGPGTGELRAFVRPTDL